MENINYRISFTEKIQDNGYIIDEFGLFDPENPFEIDTHVSNAGHKSPGQLSLGLSKDINSIQFDANLSASELQYFCMLLEDYLSLFQIHNINGKEYLIQVKALVMEHFHTDQQSQYGSMKVLELTSVTESDLKLIERYAWVKKDACEKLYNLIKKKVNNEPVKATSAIPVEITAADLATLFRLLVDQKVISKDYKKEWLYKFVAANFIPKEEQNKTTFSYIKKIFLKPPVYAVQNIEKLLADMQWRLSKLNKK